MKLSTFFSTYVGKCEVVLANAADDALAVGHLDVTGIFLGSSCPHQLV